MEDETEYETVNRRSTLLILLFDLLLNINESTQAALCKQRDMQPHGNTNRLLQHLFHIHFLSYMHTISHIISNHSLSFSLCA